MFSSFMVNAWVVGSIVGVVAGTVGFFTLIRGSAFAAHAIPNGSFAGAAAANLASFNPLLGLGLFSAASAAVIALLSRRGRPDVAIALTLTGMLALGSLLLSLGSAYSSEVYALLFGELLGVSDEQLVPTVILSVACVLLVAVFYRRLLLSSVSPGSSGERWLGLLFLGLLALLTTIAVPVVGTLLIFSLTAGAPSAAMAITKRPHVALALAVLLALGCVWSAIALSFWTSYPVGFFVGAYGALAYLAGRWLHTPRRRRNDGR